jgi:hypothetical protein
MCLIYHAPANFNYVREVGRSRQYVCNDTRCSYISIKPWITTCLCQVDRTFQQPRGVLPASGTQSAAYGPRRHPHLEPRPLQARRAGDVSSRGAACQRHTWRAAG